MNDTLSKQLNKEMLNFLGLSVINIIFSAIFLSVGIMLIVNNIFLFDEYITILNPLLVYVIAGFILSFIGLFWILKSVLVMDFFTDFQFKLSWTKNTPNDDQITKSIVKIISYYRENSSKINKMMIISIAGGIFFILNSLYYVIDIIIQYNDSFQLSFYYMRILAIIFMVFLSFLSLYIPYFIKNSASIWDERFKKIQEAEEIIKQQMERL